MIDKLRKRMNDEQGFTLIELLVVIIIIGILLAIAVPSYLGFKDKANKTAAQANVRTAIPSAEAFYSDHDTYVGMDDAATGLKFYDAGVAALVDNGQASTTSYCIYSKVGNFEYFKKGPDQPITADADSSDTTHCV
jgi:prepilin-type N-terminal cleavage/methylation domain-containing protein